MDPREATNAAAHKVRDLGEFIRQQRHQAELPLRSLAEQAGVSNPYLSQIERGLRRPSAEILQRVAKALRIRAETLYVKAGILEEGEGDLAARIAAAPDLTDKQRRALLEVYLSFRRENGLEPLDQPPVLEPPAPVEDPDGAQPTAGS